MVGKLSLVHINSGETLAMEVEMMDSFWSRFRGLMFRRKFEEGEALLFEFPRPRKFRIHTFFVFFPIDLIYLDGNWEVIDVKKGLSPWSTYNPDVRGRFLVELPAGVVDRVEVEIGDGLELQE